MIKLCLAVAIVALCSTTAAAQGIRCSAFLHNADGSWSSFYDGTILGPRGPIPVVTGERLTRRAGGAKAAVADALDAMCTSE